PSSGSPCRRRSRASRTRPTGCTVASAARVPASRRARRRASATIRDRPRSGRRLCSIDWSTTAGTAGTTLLAAIPLGLTAWALLDAARRPAWAWALAGRRRVVWIAAILFGGMTLALGLVVSAAYLARVRREVRAAEQGQLDRITGPASLGGGGP